MELKKIPKCPHLVIGHNGIGEFTIWYFAPSLTLFEVKLQNTIPGRNGEDQPTLLFLSPWLRPANFVYSRFRDISKRRLVSRFASPSNLIFEFIPTSLFAWHPVHSHSTIEDHVDMILAATKLWFSKGINNKTLVPAEVKDTAIWLLVSTDLDSNAKCDHAESPASPARCWRLALLVKNQVILGSQLDPRYHFTYLHIFVVRLLWFLNVLRKVVLL